MSVRIYTAAGVDAALQRLQNAIDAVGAQGYDDTDLRAALTALQNTVSDHTARIGAVEARPAYDDTAIAARITTLEASTKLVVAEDGLTATLGE